MSEFASPPASPSAPPREPPSDSPLPPSRLHRACLAAVLLVALAVRVIGLGSVPPPLFRDEAEKGYNAWCLLQTGRDYEGRRLPLFINAFGAHTSAIYQYATIPWLALFGLKVWAVRLTSALVGFATVALLYLFARALFDRETALIAAAILAVSPWHVCFSRWAQQGIFMPFLFTLAAWGVVRFRQGWRPGMPVAAAAIGLSAYAYDVGRVLSPLFLLLLVSMARTQIGKHRGLAAVSALMLAILVAPTAWFVSHQTAEAMARFRRISIIQPGMTPPEIAGRFLANYASHLNPYYLAIQGDAEVRHSIGPRGSRGATGHIGLMYPLDVVFLAAGLYFLGRAICSKVSRPKGDETDSPGGDERIVAALVIGWIAIAPVASSMTREGVPHALRSLAGAPAFGLAAAVGFVGFVRWLPKKVRWWAVATLVGVEIACASFALCGYFARYPTESESAWQYGVGESLAYCREQGASAAEVWISEAVGGLQLPPDIISPAECFAAFYGGIQPREFQQGRLSQTRFRVIPVGALRNALLTAGQAGPRFVITFVGEMPGMEPAKVFTGQGPALSAVAVYRVEAESKGDGSTPTRSMR